MNTITKYWVKETNSEITIVYAEAENERLMWQDGRYENIGHCLQMLREPGCTVERLIDFCCYDATTDDDEIDEWLEEIDGWESFNKSTLADEDGLYEAKGYVGEQVLRYIQLKEKGLKYLEEQDTVDEITDLVRSFSGVIEADTTEYSRLAAMLKNAKTVAKICRIMADKLPENPTFEQVVSLTGDWEVAMEQILGFGTVNVSAWREDEDGDLEEVPYAEAKRIEIATTNCQIDAEPRYRSFGLHEVFVDLIYRLLKLEDPFGSYDRDREQEWTWIEL